MHETFYTYDALGRRITEFDGPSTNAGSACLLIDDGSAAARVSAARRTRRLNIPTTTLARRAR